MTQPDTPTYPAVDPQVDLPSVDREILAFWHDRKIFVKSLAKTADSHRWTFYEGPPTANGRPGAHHVEARVFKDVFPRFQTMRGRHVARKAGWDCHGLPVEVEVEKELGLSGKRAIEDYGIAEFNAACRASVQRYVGAFTELTERMGYWVNLSEAYWTMQPAYVESVWWSLKQIFDKGLLVRDHRISPYCPRCGTALSDHEMGQPGVYQPIADPSVYVRLPLTSGPLAGKAALLVWTTTPWTLVSNTAVAVHPDVDYAAATDGAETLVVAEELLETLGEGWKVAARFSGTELERWTYSRPFELVDIPDAHYVVVDRYVSTEDGTGLVHQAPAFGEDDYRVARAYGLPVVNPILPDGTFDASVPLVGGSFFKDADPPLVADLERRGLLFRGESYEHSYPHCWRCDTVLLYYAVPSWFIRTTAVKDQLLAENDRTTWYPATIKHGRYGEWLRNNVDWALSRNRYWGTPLPVWECGQGHFTCVGSLAELGDLAGRDLADLDPHRPFVDDIAFACPHGSPESGGSGGCGAECRRVSEVIDAWYDSGAMPFAQWGYPWVDGSKEQFEPAYPAQFICEAIDQTRGWFYSLMAVGTLVLDRSSYENVLCLGLILAEDGRKMSTRLGNAVQPIPLIERHGADAVRWFMACSGSAWAARRLGDATIQEIVRKVVLTYWNTVAFHTLYARLAGWTPASHAAGQEPTGQPVLDRWLRSEAHRLVRDVEAAYERFDTQRVGQLVAQFVDDLSNWYVRRSRRRFWSGDAQAFATLHEALELLTKVLAPLTPFVTERVWQVVVRPVVAGAPESVHLADWPAVAADTVDDDLAAQVRLARRVVELGRAARAEAKVRTRQPLSRALVGAPGWQSLPAALRQEVADELNVLEVQGLVEAGTELVEYAVKPNFRALGRRFGKDTPRVAGAVTGADAARLATDLREFGSTNVDLDGESIELSGDEVVVSERPREGWAVANAHGETVALDLAMTADLRRAGLARELIRTLQEARKARGLEVSDRIALWWSASTDEAAAALREYESIVGDEVLAAEITEGAPLGDDAGLDAHRVEDLGLTYWFRKL